MPVLSVKIVLDCFCLLIFYPEKNSTDVCRLPYAVNVNLILFNVFISTNNNFARASRYFVHFFAVVSPLRHETY